MIHRLAALATAAALVLGVAACSSGSPKPKASGLNDKVGGKYAGFGLTPPQPRPSFTLTDTHGKAFSFGQQTAGHPTLLFFGYTNCPDVCPTTLADINQALQKLPKAAQQKVDVVFVSTDVKRDTGPVIAQWLKNFDTGVAATFIGLRGSQAQIDAAQVASHITLAEDNGETHSASVTLYGTDDYARVMYVQSDGEAAEIAHDLPLVSSGSAG